jgi:hypothetical protein
LTHESPPGKGWTARRFEKKGGEDSLAAMQIIFPEKYPRHIIAIKIYFTP